MMIGAIKWQYLQFIIAKEDRRSSHVPHLADHHQHYARIIQLNTIIIVNNMTISSH